MADAIAGFTAVDEVVLCVSEVATNAVVHGSPEGGAQITVRVRWLVPSRVYVAVIDRGVPEQSETTVPHRVEAASADEGFRGLAIVDDVAAVWGAAPLAGGGHRVWFEVITP